MGMVLVGCRLSADELQMVLDDPTKIESLLIGEDGGDGEDDDDIFEPGPDAEPELDLDKSWQGIHYLITGTAWGVGEGASAAVLGGEEIGEDLVYGPARLISAEAVPAIAAGLDALDIETLRARFGPAALAAAEIYPEIWADNDDTFDEYLAPYFTKLCQFYQAAAENGQAVLLAIV